MKKFVFSLLFFIFTFSLFSNEIPQELYGIWEGKDRFVFFEKNENDDDNEAQIVILLKEYYGWYYDRAAEPENYSEKEKRVRNTGTTRKAENVYLFSNQISKSSSDSAWELTLKYSNFQSSKIAIALVDDNLFLNFYLKDDENQNYYRGNAVSEGIKVSQQKIPQNISCLYFKEDQVFDIRYWQTDMDYVDEKVTLNYKDSAYNVDKHIYSCGNNYSCVSGRSKKIRNVVDPVNTEEINLVFNEDKSIIIMDTEPYLTKLADKSTFEDLMNIVKEGNSRRKPDPDPIFPPNDINWHWDLIDVLEANNEIIQAVRARQKAFGLRAKDIGK